MENIIMKLRDLIVDNYKFNSETQEYYGGAKIFPLEYSNIDESSLVVKKNGSIWADTNYSYSNGKVTVTGTLTSGDNLTFEYNAYEKYSDIQLKGYIRSSFYCIAVEKYKVFTVKTNDIIFPTPSEEEECLIAVIAAILIKGNIRQYRTPEFTISYDTDNISIESKIKIAVRQFKKAYGVLDYIDLTQDLADTTDD